MTSLSSGTKASATLGKNRKGHLKKKIMTKSGTLRGYAYFRHTPLSFVILKKKYSTAVTVGMYVVITAILVSMVCPLATSSLDSHSAERKLVS